MRLIKLPLIIIYIFSTFFLFLNVSFAQDLTNITPTLNITNAYINSRQHIIYIDYQNEIGISESKSVTLYEDGVEIITSSEINGNILTITKNTYYHELKTYRLVVTDIESVNESLNFEDIDTTFRYTSLKTFVIGKTVKGRDIKAYSIGEGNQVYLLLGAIHGNEKNTSKLVFQILSNFLKNPDWLPTDTKIVFVPTINVDGYVRNGRFNLNGVDLNRNSKTKDWQSLTYWGYLKIKNGGGINPNTQPELRAVQNLIKNIKPFLTISYHSAGNYVITNGPDAREYAKTYSKYSRYKYVDQSSGDTGFEYKITGDLTTWMRDRGYNALTVELKSRIYTEITPNLNALKDILSNY